MSPSSPAEKRDATAVQSSSSSSSASPSTSDSGEDEYCEAGLHAVRVGDVYGGRFRAEGPLGSGQFSTVWLCRDLHGGPDVALKVYKSVKRFAGYAKEEAQILQSLKKCDFSGSEGYRPACQSSAFGGAASCVVAMLDSLVHEQTGCSHACVALEALGPSLLEVAQSCRGDRLPWHLLRAAARDSFRGLDFMHRGCRIVHTDIKPENILARVDGAALAELRCRGRCGKRRRVAPSAGLGFSGGASSFPLPFGPGQRRRRCTGRDVLELHGVTFVLADLGNSCFCDTQVSDCISTCEYKAPEVLLGAGYSTGADLWSLSCTLFEAATGRYLFDPRRVLARPAVLAAADQQAAQLATAEAASAAAVPAAATPACCDAQQSAPSAPGRSKPRPQRGSAKVPLAEEHIAQIVELLGVPPEALFQRSKQASELLCRGADMQWTLRTTALPLSGLPRCTLASRMLEHTQGSEVQLMIKLLGAALVFEPRDRPDARTLLEDNSSWLWAAAGPGA